MTRKWSLLLAVLLTGLFAAGTVTAGGGGEGDYQFGWDMGQGDVTRTEGECKDATEVFGILGDQTQLRLRLAPDGDPHPDPGEYPRQEQHK